MKSISEVITALDEIIESSIRSQSPLGYFAALYRKVTIKIQHGIDNNEFDNGELVEKLDIIFAQRYLDAYTEYLNGKTTTLSWGVAMSAGHKWNPIVIQHLLFGMNAHINLDLGVSMFQSSPDSIERLKGDFDKVNDILSSLVDTAQKDLTEIWPLLKWILRITGKIDNVFIDFSMKKARDGAWKFAQELSMMPNELIQTCIEERDMKVAKVSRLISMPGILISGLLILIRIFEVGSTHQKIIKLRD